VSTLWLAVLAAWFSDAAAPAPTPALSVYLKIRVAECADPSGARVPTRPRDWVDARVRAVQDLLAPHGIAVTATSDTFVPPLCEALSREDRDRFAPAVAPGPAVTVLVVPRVRDLEVLSYDLRGVHWRGGGRRWIFLTARAEPPALAHELCHYFGLPHDPAGGNLMAPGPSSPLRRSGRKVKPFVPILTPAQVRSLRAGIARSGRQVADVRDQVVR
jgi:hypothetical protein